MSRILGVPRALLQLRGTGRRFGPGPGAFRTFSGSAASGDVTLPLEGYRVLDMTRVLAGVRLLQAQGVKA